MLDDVHPFVDSVQDGVNGDQSGKSSLVDGFILLIENFWVFFLQIMLLSFSAIGILMTILPQNFFREAWRVAWIFKKMRFWFVG